MIDRIESSLLQAVIIYAKDRMLFLPPWDADRWVDISPLHDSSCSRSIVCHVSSASSHFPTGRKFHALPPLPRTTSTSTSTTNPRRESCSPLHQRPLPRLPRYGCANTPESTLLSWALSMSSIVPCTSQLSEKRIWDLRQLPDAIKSLSLWSINRSSMVRGTRPPAPSSSENPDARAIICNRLVTLQLESFLAHDAVVTIFSAAPKVLEAEPSVWGSSSC